MKISTLVLAAIIAVTPFAAKAEDAMKMPADHKSMSHEDMMSKMGPSDKAFMECHEKMMKDMAMKPTGDADKDFVAMMIPHHQGAIDMAEVELKYGKDPAIRKMAEDIIKAQKAEIEAFKKWQTAK